MNSIGDMEIARRSPHPSDTLLLRYVPLQQQPSKRFGHAYLILIVCQIKCSHQLGWMHLSGNQYNQHVVYIPNMHACIISVPVVRLHAHCVKQFYSRGLQVHA